MRIRTYSELMRFDTLEERFKYLSLRASVGAETFGFDRWLNQQFYTSRQWRHIRHHIIIRDNGCDLSVEDHVIPVRPIIHHMNPMSVANLSAGDPEILDPEFLITTSFRTHNAIHYGDERLLPRPLVERKPGDTKLW